MKEDTLHPRIERIGRTIPPEVVIMSTDAIRKTDAYKSKCEQVTAALGIDPHEFARYPGAYMITEAIKHLANSSHETPSINEAEELKKILPDGQITFTNEAGYPTTVQIGDTAVSIEWAGDRIKSLVYKGLDGNDTTVAIPRDATGRIIIGDLGEPLSGRDIPYQALAEQMAEQMHSWESGDAKVKKITLVEFFLRNTVELDGFFHRVAREKENAGVQSKRKTVLVALKAFEGEDRRAQMDQRMSYRAKQGSPSEVTDSNLAERLNSQYQLTAEDMRTFEGSEVIDSVIAVDNTTTALFDDASPVNTIEERIRETLLANAEIRQLLQECTDGGIDIFITGPVASGKSAVVDVLRKMITEEADTSL